MAIKSGSGKASLILANETRSGLRDREGNGQLLPGEMRRVRAVLRIGTDEDGWIGDNRTGTVKAARARDETAELRNRRQGDARQPCILSWGVPGYNPSAQIGRTGGARGPRQGKGGLPRRQGSWSKGQVRAVSRSARPSDPELLDLDGGPGALEGRLGLLGVFLVGL